MRTRKTERQHDARGEQGRQSEETRLIVIRIEYLDDHERMGGIKPRGVAERNGRRRERKCVAGPSPRRQNFRVPLNAENPSMLGALDAFDDAVLGDGVGHQTAADFFHRLMMGGVYFHFSAADDGVKPRACCYVHLMAAMVFARALSRGRRRRQPVFQCLDTTSRPRRRRSLARRRRCPRWARLVLRPQRSFPARTSSGAL